MNALTNEQVETLLAESSGPVSYQSRYARTTATVQNGRVMNLQYARDYLTEMLDAERKAAYVAPVVPTVSGVRTQPYAGPFPRGKHSHHCRGCEPRGQINSVACYKQQCRRPQLVATCEWCREYYYGGAK